MAQYDTMQGPAPQRRRSNSPGGLTIVTLVISVIALITSTTAIVLVLQGGAAPAAVAQAVKTSTSPASEESTAATRPSPSPSPTQPRTEAGARAAAQVTFDLYSAGQYGRFWDHWSSGAQGVVSRADYVRRFKLCPPIAEGLRFEITDVVVSGTTAKVTTGRSIITTTYDFAYQRGAWRYIPLAKTRQEYWTKTIDELVAADRAQGLCG
ncbi:hypothetical protein ACQP25_01755 [Microtetraspora malaysiensis]|uniref:hypothetical protein n=1 Tax=Microtetraspora malaysiensis TaxID=161358 RepID=UPI003D89EBA0